MTIRFDGRVAIVTGAGVGLGRSHALGLAERGATVVVNDLGVATDGSAAGSPAAQAVVEEIRAMGGTAMANGADVTDAEAVQAMVDEAIVEFGQVDILVNNAGILRDKSFTKMELTDFQKVVDVHLLGSVNCTKAVWDHMNAREYGRIVMTTSGSGMYGNFGQSNYGAAKAGVVGFMNVLAQFAETKITETPGVALVGDDLTADGVWEALDQIRNPEGATEMAGAFDQTKKYVDMTGKGQETCVTPLSYPPRGPRLAKPIAARSTTPMRRS
ncbi:MAG: SDR family NAD(P)-dependent oxidoreductase [Maritimibacter sp.]